MAPFRNLNERIKTTFWTQQTKKLIETKFIWSSSRHHFNKFYSMIHGAWNLCWSIFNNDFVKLLKKECSSHSNRFIRENSFYICSAVLNETLNSAPELIDDFAKLIYKGLSDNWSQVRMSSSAAGRKRVNFGSLVDSKIPNFLEFNYAGYHEMPQKACERCIFHVMPYAFYFEMPQIRTISFSVDFSF